MAETWVFSGPNNTPTEAEKRLIAAAEAGEVADCSGLSKTERVVSASLLVAVASGVFKPFGGEAWSLHPDGVMLGKAVIKGNVWATNIAFPAPLAFRRCRFSNGVSFVNATVDGILRLDGCLFKGECDFSGADIAGQFTARGTRFLNRGGRAVRAQGVRAEGWFVDRAYFCGAVEINSANISGQFSGNGARFFHGGSRAIFAQMSIIRGGFFLREGARVLGTVDLAQAEVGQALDLGG